MAGDPYPESYCAARAAFLSAAHHAGASVESLPIRAVAPNGTALAIDVARIGLPTAPHVLLVLSGTHGIEGFVGSALQSLLLETLPRTAHDVALVLVHAINPWGFAHLRRVNENNVDLNRNFLRNGEPYAGAAAGYRTLDALLNPASAPARDGFLWRAAGLVGCHGFATLRQAIAEGQYEFSQGLFFGGSELEEGPRRLLGWLGTNLAHARALRVLDLHSGLGPWGRLTLFADPGSERLTPEHGLHLPEGARIVQEHGDRKAGGYVTRGELAGKLREVLPAVRMRYFTVEVGTFGNLRILHAMRAENRWHHHGGAGLDHPTKRALLEAFCPRSTRWRACVLRRGLAVLTAFLRKPWGVAS